MNQAQRACKKREQFDSELRGIGELIRHRSITAQEAGRMVEQLAYWWDDVEQLDIYASNGEVKFEKVGTNSLSSAYYEAAKLRNMGHVVTLRPANT